MDKYEYRIIPRKRELSEKELNNLGEEGWELCSMQVAPLSLSCEYIFKRKRRLDAMREEMDSKNDTSGSKHKYTVLPSTDCVPSV